MTIQCDASQSGLGAALLQNGQPVAYASRALTDAETRYAQIEKELLAIVFACERFEPYVYGRDKVKVDSDHKPLEYIFQKPLHSAPKRTSENATTTAEVQPECGLQEREGNVPGRHSEQSLPT